jgi:hypothetical protein
MAVWLQIRTKWTNFTEDLSEILYVKCCFIWQNGFRGNNFLEIDQPETRIAYFDILSLRYFLTFIRLQLSLEQHFHTHRNSQKMGADLGGKKLKYFYWLLKYTNASTSSILKDAKSYCTMLHLFDDLWLDKIIPKNNDRSRLQHCVIYYCIIWPWRCPK